MKSRLISSCVVGLLGSLAVAAQATPTLVTTITNQNTSSNPNCTVEGAGGAGGGQYTYVGYRVKCSGTVIAVTLTYQHPGNYCTVSGGATFTGTCSNYSIYL